MAGGPLEVLTMVDMTQVVVGPLATQILADHGADVIKVEARAGDLMRNLNGRSVTPGMSASGATLDGRLAKEGDAVAGKTDG